MSAMVEACGVGLDGRAREVGVFAGTLRVRLGDVFVRAGEGTYGVDRVGSAAVRAPGWWARCCGGWVAGGAGGTAGGVGICADRGAGLARACCPRARWWALVLACGGWVLGWGGWVGLVVVDGDRAVWGAVFVG